MAEALCSAINRIEEAADLAEIIPILATVAT